MSTLLDAIDLPGVTGDAYLDEPALDGSDHACALCDEPDADLGPELTPEEEARQDRLEAGHYASQPDYVDPVVTKALAVLRAADLEMSTEVDEGDDDGHGGGLDLYVRCARGCGSIARVVGDGLTDASNCEAPEGPGESNCQRAIRVLAEAGAFGDGWAS